MPAPAPLISHAPDLPPLPVTPRRLPPQHVVVRAPEVADAGPTDYLEAPPPRYPRDALRQRESGTVVLLVAISESGEPIGVRVLQSSGFAELDDTARRQVADRYRFKTGSARLFRVPIAFQLSD
jgi:protein TonB